MPDDASYTTGKVGRGRKSAAAKLARDSGDEATAREIAPPSERRLTDDQKCGARNQQGEPCQSGKGSRTDHPGFGHCSKHGGNTEAGKKAGAREMGRHFIWEYKKTHSRFGGNRHDPSIATLTPEQALLEEVRRSAAMVRFLEERIATWNLSSIQEETLEAFATTPRYRVGALKGQMDEFMQTLGDDNADSPHHLPPLTMVHERTGMTTFTDAREWLYLYREERGHLARVAKMALDAGVAQRIVSIAEDQGRAMASALRLVLNALNLSPEQQAMIPQIVPPILRAVATDSPLPNLSDLLASVSGAPAAIESR